MIQEYTPRVFDELPAWPAANQKIKQAEKHLPQAGPDYLQTWTRRLSRVRPAA